MSEPRAARLSASRRVVSPASPLRLDLLVNPYGASPRVIEAIASRDDLHLPIGDRVRDLNSRVGELHGVPGSWIVPANGIVQLLQAALRLAGGPVALFPPTDPEHARLAGYLDLAAIEVPRSHRFAVDLDPAGLALPADGVSLVQSPNDPTGTVLSAQDAVRLSRKSRLLIVDERHAGYNPRSLVPLVGEFDNVAVLRTFETWAGLTGFPFAYAVAPPKLAARLAGLLLQPEIAAASAVAAEATLDDLGWVLATVDRVREERARLHRTLRKLNMLRTYPSSANFILVRIERGETGQFFHELVNRGIHVFRPTDPGLMDCFRISATTPDATSVLKNALIDVAAKL